MDGNLPNVSIAPTSSQPPYPALPGQIIKMRLHISPDEHRSPPPVLNLVFLTTPPPQPPSTIPIPIKPVAPPDAPAWIGMHLEGGYQIALSTYQGQIQAEAAQWRQDHPQRSFYVTATTKCNENGLLELSGSIPDPSSQELRLNQDASEGALYKGVYNLQPLQFIQTCLSEPPITLDAESAKTIASYQLVVDRDYFHRIPPPPKTETITGLVIEPPSDPWKERQQ